MTVAFNSARYMDGLDDSGFEKLSLIAQGHAASQILFAAVELGVFEFLDLHPGASETEIAAHTRLEAQPARILMRGLSALDIVIFDNGKYRNSPESTKYLLQKSEDNLIDVLGWQRHIVYPAIPHFLESLTKNTNAGLRHFPGTEKTIYARIAHDPKLEQILQKAMSSLSRANNKNLISHIDMESVRHLADAGGGYGTTAIALARKHPQLRGTVFDIPTVSRQARDAIARTEVSDRVGTCSGDLFSDPFPRDIDAVLLAHVMTIWSPEKNTQLLKRAFDALPPGGKIFVFNMMANDDGSGPVSCALGSVYFMSIATGTGMLYSWSEQMEFLRNAGFKNLKKQVLPNAHGIIVGEK